ncbi:MAG: hypothetical protein ACYS8X_10475 [Planctomycetota bacterium]
MSRPFNLWLELLAAALIVGIVVAPIVWFSWPRMVVEVPEGYEPFEGIVYDADPKPDVLTVDYRGIEPFRVEVEQGSERVAVFPSAYSWPHNMQRVRMRFTRGPALTVKGNGKTVTITPGSAPDAYQARWTMGGGGSVSFLVGCPVVKFGPPERPKVTSGVWLGSSGGSPNDLWLYAYAGRDAED